MVKRRRRFKQTTSLAQRLTEEALRLRDRARRLAPGPEQTQLWRKVCQTEAALRIAEWLASPGVPPPTNAMPLMGKTQKKRASEKTSPRLIASVPK
jgi:hypothetical protein